MYVMYGQVDGLFHWYLWLSDNKGLLLLLQERNSKMALMGMDISAGDLLISTNAIYQAQRKLA